MSSSMVDKTVIKLNQFFIIFFIILSFIFKWAFIPILVSIMILNLYNIKLINYFYKYILKPLRIVKPNIEMDNNEPHNFSYKLGLTMLLTATLFFIFDNLVVGYVLVSITAFLASINLIGNYCVGCFVYYQLNKLKIPGFNQPLVCPIPKKYKIK